MKNAPHENKVVHKPNKDERAYPERNEDPYENRHKYTEPTVCTGCSAIYTKGGWRWGEAESGAHQRMCPACHRKQDGTPAGIVHVYGDFYATHRDDIVNLIKNIEIKEKSGHPLQRIMSFDANDSSITLQLTGIHLTQGIVEALKHAYQGEATIHFADKEGVMRAEWTR